MFVHSDDFARGDWWLYIPKNLTGISTEPLPSKAEFRIMGDDPGCLCGNRRDCGVIFPDSQCPLLSIVVGHSVCAGTASENSTVRPTSLLCGVLRRRTIGRRLILFRLKNAAVSTTQNWRRGDDEDWWRPARSGGYSCLRCTPGGAAVNNGGSSFRRSHGHKLQHAWNVRYIVYTEHGGQAQQQTAWRRSRKTLTL